jgi:hypothetical protein
MTSFMESDPEKACLAGQLLVVSLEDKTASSPSLTVDVESVEGVGASVVEDA